jgi:hypothetical protein
MTGHMRTGPRHECCPAARRYLKATKLRSLANTYHWRVIGTDLLITYCPWCAVDLERDRQNEIQVHLVRGEAP